MAALKLNVKIRKMELKITKLTNSWYLVLLMIRLIPHTLQLIQLVYQVQMMKISKSQLATSFYSPSLKVMRKLCLLLIKVKMLPAIMVRITFLKTYLIAINAYLSTPKFIMTLTDLSLELIAQPNRGEFLQAELKKINHKLPAAVYLPFVNGKSFLFLKIFRFHA